jgi:hypothetical protein
VRNSKIRPTVSRSAAGEGPRPGGVLAGVGEAAEVRVGDAGRHVAERPQVGIVDPATASARPP